MNKLNNTGIAHYFVPLIVIALVALSGVGYLVATHADSLSSYAATCTINNVHSSLAKASAMQPSLTVKNTGSGIISPHMISYVSTTGGPTTYFNEVGFASINPGASATQKLDISYSPSLMPSPSGPAAVVSHSDLNFNGTHVSFQCSKSFTIQ